MKTPRFLVAACISLVLAFILSCSSNDGGDNIGGTDGGNNSTQGGGSHFNPNITYGSFTDSRDGKTYRTVVIGTQTWMAENLNYDVPNNTTDACYNNEPGKCTTYGRMYNWATAMDIEQSCNSNSCASQDNHRGICPENWHIPSDTEWEVLLKYVDPNWTSYSYVAGMKLKAKSGWNNNNNGTDDYGFSALPGGDGGPDGRFFNAGGRGLWWSSSEYDNLNRDGALLREISENNAIFRGQANKVCLWSVRCVKD